MKKLFPLLFLYLLSNESFVQQLPRLLVRGDDMGYTHSGNEALIICYQQGIEKSIEVLVSSPWFPEAVKLLKKNPGIDVGIHLDLTSEWENIKWRPLLKAVYHIGYEDVCEDRQGVTDLFTSEKVKAVIKQKGIQLITYRDLK